MKKNFRLLGVRCWVLGVRCWVLGVGCWMLGVGCWVLGVTNATAQRVTYRSTQHYNERVELFERLDDIDSTKIVMLGNSLTENAINFGDWKTLLRSPNVVNRGISGDDALGITSRLVQILPYKPKAIFLMCGTNDMSHHLTAEQVFYKVKGVIDSIRSGAPETVLYVQSLLPINEGFGRWKNLVGRTDDIPVTNDLLRQYCEEQGIQFINIFPYLTARGGGKAKNVLIRYLSVDGLHLSRPGYEIWAQHLQPYIDEVNWEEYLKKAQ